ncbi:MAG: DUF2752 domain-containing protein [Proteobacteria bacterium]|nr:DUF2752 domain-containing protein [Pseudomonadota bacterium]
MPDWGWALTLFLTGVLAVGVSFIFYPSEDPNWTMILGRQFGGECGFQVALGLPCPSCGMTRSWVWLVRGEVVKSFTYNAAGSLLLIWLAVGGLLGGLRLVTRNYKLLTVPFNALFWWTMFWLIGPYLGMWVARMIGFNAI